MIKKLDLSPVAGLLVSEAKYYRNGEFKDILPYLLGAMINETSIRQIIEPYIEGVEKILHESVSLGLTYSLIGFVPEAIDQMYMNPHMHDGDETCLISEANAVALLVTFLHFSCNLPKLTYKDLLIN